MGDAAKILWPRLHRPTVWFVEHSNTKVLGLDENLTAFFFGTTQYNLNEFVFKAELTQNQILERLKGQRNFSTIF